MRELVCMKMKKAIGTKLVLLVLCIFLLLSACGETTGYTTLSGTYIETESGKDVMLITQSGDDKFVFMYPKEDEGIFDELRTGDIIQIQIVLVQENDAYCTTEVFECTRLRQGSMGELSDEQIALANSLASKMK